jgi:MarR family transcriptional regulator, transcriptional regulator for hemolysin
VTETPARAAPPRSIRREIGFLLSDVARLLRTATDQKARLHGTTRAQWAVLLRLERHQGLSQSDLAAMLDIQPITLARLVDKLCQEGLVERRPDPTDRRINRLFLQEAAYPVLRDLQELGNALMTAVLEGLPDDAIEGMAGHLARIKDNLKRDLHGSGRAAAATRTE